MTGLQTILYLYRTGVKPLSTDGFIFNGFIFYPYDGSSSVRTTTDYRQFRGHMANSASNQSPRLALPEGCVRQAPLHLERARHAVRDRPLHLLRVDTLLPVDHNEPIARQKPNQRACVESKPDMAGQHGQSGWLADRGCPELGAASGMI